MVANRAVGWNSVLGLASLATIALFVHLYHFTLLSYKCITSTAIHTAQTTKSWVGRHLGIGLMITTERIRILEMRRLPAL
jgi:hypothetical protein